MAAVCGHGIFDINSLSFMKKIEVPEIDDDIYIKGLTLKERLEIEKLDVGKQTDSESQHKVLLQVVTLALYDSVGNKIFDSDKGQEVLNDLPAVLIQRFFEEIVAHNFSTAASVESVKKK